MSRSSSNINWELGCQIAFLPTRARLAQVGEIVFLLPGFLMLVFDLMLKLKQKLNGELSAE
jgi:hypothetical protein